LVRKTYASTPLCYDGAMAATENEERELRINLMQTQIELYKAQLRWEPWKALAAMVAAAAVFMGGVLAVANWTRPSAPSQIVLQPGTTIQVLPAPDK
jgi:hypothetical protein